LQQPAWKAFMQVLSQGFDALNGGLEGHKTVGAIGDFWQEHSFVVQDKRG
jgi:hypothetical protein